MGLGSRLGVVAIVATVATACGGEDTRVSRNGPGGGGSGASGEGGSSDGGCGPGEALYEGTCHPAGLPPGWTAPGPSVEPTPGVPADACGEGFVSDGLGGCEAILPPTPCTGSAMAVPGDAACRPIMECGEGTWGDIPVDATTVYVDASFVGAPDGSAAAPYPTIQAAVDAAEDGELVAVAAGSYAEDVVISGKAIALWGRCPDLVTVQGQGTFAAIELDAAPGAEVHGFAVSGPGHGVVVIDAPGAWIDRTHAHDTDLPGVGVVGQGEPVTVTDSLIVDSPIAGILSQGQTVVERCEVRGTEAATTMRGIACYPQGTEPVSLRVTGSHVNDAVNVGVVGLSAQVDIERTVIRDTKPLNAQSGWGIFVNEQEGPAGALTVSQSVIAGNTTGNLSIAGVPATVEATTIEHAAVDASSGVAVGISVSEGVATPTAGELTLTRSTVRHHRSAAVDVDHAVVEMSDVLVHDVTPNASTGDNGQGLRAGFSSAVEGASEILVERSIIEQTHDAGMALFDVTGTVRDSVVRDVSDRPDDDEISVGVIVGPSIAQALASSLVVERVRVEGVEGVGLFAQGAALTVRDTEVTDIRVIDDLQGSSITGVAVGAGSEELTTPSELVVAGCHLRDLASRGIVTFAAQVDVSETLIEHIDTGDPFFAGTGRAIELQESNGIVRWSEIGDVQNAGLLGFGGDISVEAVHVHDVASGLDVGATGLGIDRRTGEPARTEGEMTVEGCRVERVAGGGLFANRASMTVRRTDVRDITSDDDGAFGRGILAQYANAFEVSGSSVEATVDGGIVLIGAPASITDTTIRQVSPIDDGLFGDGLIVESSTPVTLDGITISDVARAGIANFSSQVTLTNADLRCNDLPLVTESVDEAATIEDGGGNRCGCEVDQPCKAVSANLEPPEALPPNEPAPDG